MGPVISICIRPKTQKQQPLLIAPSNLPAALVTPRKLAPLRFFAVGEVGVGKTSIFTRFFMNCFDLKVPLESFFPAKEVNVHTPVKKTYKGIGQDTRGNECLHLTNGYNTAHIILIVFDTTSKQSFESAFDYWLPQVDRNASKATRVIIGTKIDLTGDRIVSQAEAEERCSKYKMKYFECSALQDDGTITSIFSSVASLRLAEKGEVSGEESDDE